MADANAVLVQSIQTILQQAVGAVQQPSPQPPPRHAAQPSANQAAANATNALAGLVASLVTALSPDAATPAPTPQGSSYETQYLGDYEQGADGTSPLDVSWDAVPQESSEPLEPAFSSIEEFVGVNGLEQWVVDAMYLLTPEQQAKVMASPINMHNTTNLNGVITSRIKEVAPHEQRLQIFIQLNGLAEGVVDRLGTLTEEQREKVMESTLKIQKANNPSGVAMRRISDVLKHERLGIHHGPHMSSPNYGSQGPSSAASSLQPAIKSIVDALTGAASGGGGAGARDRSRSRPPAGVSHSGGVSRDIQSFLDDYRLDWWVGEVLTRLSLWQRQNVMQELGNMHGVRNPSGVVMARVKQAASTQELLTIFIDINSIEGGVSEELWTLSEEQQIAVMAPGIYVQNARNSSVAVRTRIRHVLAGNDAMGGAKRGGGSGIDPAAPLAV